MQALDIYEAIQHRSSFNVVHLASMIKVDVFLAPDRPFDRSKAQRAQFGLITTRDPRPFRLTSAEDIVLQKLEWYALGGRVSALPERAFVQVQPAHQTVLASWDRLPPDASTVWCAWRCRPPTSARCRYPAWRLRA